LEKSDVGFCGGVCVYECFLGNNIYDRKVQMNIHQSRNNLHYEESMSVREQLAEDNLEKLKQGHMDHLITTELEDRFREPFNNQARYMGNGVYAIAGLHSNDTQELFKMFVCQQEFQMEFE